MTDTIKTEPTPIQRNDKDVAVELTKLYYQIFACDGADEIANIYLKFYATSYGAYNQGRSLTDFMPDELKKLFKKD
jgi:hypothetical protein